MKLSQLDYHLPTRNIAHSPITPRDHSKLMIINRSSQSISHKHFYDLADLLTEDDVLVFNQTKVFPAKLVGKKQTGGVIELLLLKETSPLVWQAMHKGKVKMGQKLQFDNSQAAVQSIEDNIITVKFSSNPKGQIPLPPYIHSPLSENELIEKYQTVYAKDIGSVAAPTAGFHFTNDLLSKLKDKGVQMEYITLHVGPGTFLPIKTDDLSKHTMHSEYFELSKDTAKHLNQAKENGKRIIAIGTTTTRVLESCTKKDRLNSKSGETNIFIYPPYKFKYIDGLITNFHLPHSTLLALVSAFISYPNTKEMFTDFNNSLIGRSYKEAIANDYRFYSFGDSSIIL